MGKISRINDLRVVLRKNNSRFPPGMTTRKGQGNGEKQQQRNYRGPSLRSG